MLFFPQKCQNNRSSLIRSDWMQTNSWVVNNKTTGCIFQSKFDLGRAGKCCTKIYLRNSTYIKNYFAFFHIQISEVSSRSTYTTKIIYCNSIYRQLPEYLNNRLQRVQNYIDKCLKVLSVSQIRCLLASCQSKYQL